MNAFAKEPETESQLQASVVGWLRLQESLDRLTFFAIANGEKRRPRTGKKLQTQGVRAGVPDLCVVMKGRTHFIELKTEKGRLSDAQVEMHVKIMTHGASVLVARSLGAVITYVDEQLGRKEAA